MKSLYLIFLLGYVAKCDVNNYYVVEMGNSENDDTPYQEPSKPFKVYWNVPTIQCQSKRIPFKNLYEKYGIHQNHGDSFRGEVISILYDPGLFPALLKNVTSGRIKFRNGGVPQEGDLKKHISYFRTVLDQSIPDEEFSGAAIIDFESWRPIFRHNFGALIPYKDVSYEIERKKHWWWPKQWIQAEAQQRYEEAGRVFMQTTLSVAKKMRPNAMWGYYGFPYCYNMANRNLQEACADKVPEENNRLYWLWAESLALYPSVYSSRELDSSQLAALIRGRVRESDRVKKGAVILPYFWFRYIDGGFFSKEDLTTAIATLYKSKASGFIIWGSSSDVSTVDKCKKLLHYLENTLGPAIAEYTKQATNLNDDTTTSEPDFFDKPDFNQKNDWDPLENYPKNIERNYKEEINKNLGYQSTGRTLRDNKDSVYESKTEVSTDEKKVTFPHDLTTQGYGIINTDLQASSSTKNNIETQSTDKENTQIIVINNYESTTDNQSTPSIAEKYLITTEEISKSQPSFNQNIFDYNTTVRANEVTSEEVREVNPSTSSTTDQVVVYIT